MAKYIPQGHPPFNSWQKQLVKGLLTNPATKKVAPFPPAPGAAPANWQKWAIPEADIQKLVDAQVAYQPAYDKWSDEDGRNKSIVEFHKKGRKIYEKLLRKFVARWLRHNEKVTTGNKASLSLTVPDEEPTAVTVTDSGPKLSIQTIRPGLHIIRVANPENPTTSAMPKGHRLMLERFIGPVGLKETDLKWSTYKTVGRFLIKVEFTAKDKGQMAYYRAFYLTTRGERSPVSTVLKMGIV